jgi:tetratricopeptide (TPR) repeat protein
MYYLIFRVFLGNSILALIMISIIYLLIDRQFIGLFPDFLKPFKRSGRIKALEEQVKLNPADVNAYRELGLSYLEGKKYSRAVHNFEKCLPKMDEYADIHFYLGKTLYFLGEKEKSQQEILKALNINPKVGYGEPYIYLLEYAINSASDKIEEYTENIERFGTPEILYKGGHSSFKV